MTTPLLCLVLFAAWTVLLVLGVVSFRSFVVLGGEKGPNDFPSGEPHGPAAYRRLCRAHANAVENLVVFAALVLVAHLVGVRGPVVDLLCMIVVGARVLQSLLHIGTANDLLGFVRFGSFLVQIGCFAGLMVLLLRAA